MENTSYYVAQFSHSTQNAIKKEVQKKLIEQKFTSKKIKEGVQNSLNSRLCDLDELIDITKYIPTKKNHTK